MYAILAIVSSLYLLYYLRQRQARLPLPPGPKGRFLVGNINDIPSGRHQWKVFSEWGKIYDPDILYLNFAGQSVIALNTLEAAQELFDRRSAVYSSRPRLPMLVELMGWDFAFTLMKYGATWRTHRKFMHQSFNPMTVTRFKPHILKSTHTLLRNLLIKPEEFGYHIRHHPGVSMAAEIIMMIAYGIQIQPHQDPIIEVLEKALDSATAAAIPGRFLRQAKEWRKLVVSMVEDPYRTAKEAIVGDLSAFLVSDTDGLQMMENVPESPEEWECVIKQVAGTMYSAASDTTVAAILTGILGLVCYPDVLNKAQAEMDRVIKHGNLPDFNDRESLPYLTAVVKEILRWSPPSPMGLPHYLDAEDTYKGFRVPVGSIIFANIWGIMHDESVYSDPFIFNPDRFLKDGKINREICDPEDVIFGFGRRVCPGQHFAIMSIWMTIASIVAAFDILKPLDKDGNVKEPTQEWTTSNISHPLPFECRIVPRSEQAMAAIQRTEAYEYFNE
ncbi:hypothetical protein AX16_004463 [Volvariella volvacea WC 439]|nr:hypothetical protein AX16_004463 [Volvariella volvacea WC 439]